MYYFLFFLSLLFYPFSIFFHLFQLATHKHGFQTIKEKWGFPTISKAAETLSWVHVSSIGEFHAALPFLKKYKKKFQRKLFITYFNPDSKKKIEDSGIAERSFALALENPWGYRKIIESLHPRECLFFEMELWPLLICSLKRHRIPFRLINAYLYPETFKRYLFFKWFFSALFKSYTAIYVHSERDKSGFVALGAHPSKIVVSGDLKYDLIEIREKKYERARLNLLGKKIVVFASIHKKELSILEPVIADYLDAHAKHLVLLAPRDLRYLKAVQKKFSGYAPRLFSEMLKDKASLSQAVNMIIVDTFGDLRSLYAIADIAVMGGSFIAWGGQNPLEAVAQNTPTLMGPYSHHFQHNIDALYPHIRVIERKDLAPYLIDYQTRAKTREGEKKLRRLCGSSERILAHWGN